jgi:hypothetical protein
MAGPYAKRNRAHPVIAAVASQPRRPAARDHQMAHDRADCAISSVTTISGGASSPLITAVQ